MFSYIFGNDTTLDDLIETGSFNSLNTKHMDILYRSNISFMDFLIKLLDAGLISNYVSMEYIFLLLKTNKLRLTGIKNKRSYSHLIIQSWDRHRNNNYKMNHDIWKMTNFLRDYSSKDISLFREVFSDYFGLTNVTNRDISIILLSRAKDSMSVGKDLEEEFSIREYV